MKRIKLIDEKIKIKINKIQMMCDHRIDQNEIQTTFVEKWKKISDLYWKLKFFNNGKYYYLQDRQYLALELILEFKSGNIAEYHGAHHFLFRMELYQFLKKIRDRQYFEQTTESVIDDFLLVQGDFANINLLFIRDLCARWEKYKEWENWQSKIVDTEEQFYPYSFNDEFNTQYLKWDYTNLIS